MPRSKKPASLMFLGVIASTGEFCPPIWFPEGFRLSADDYIAVLRCKVIPWMCEVAGHHQRPFVFQQDGAPAHTAKKTAAFLQSEEVPFWGSTMWPPNSPDLNSLDYAVWSHVQTQACGSRPANLRIMKRRVSAAWRAIPEEKIRVFCRCFRARLEKCVATNGSIFEK